jgi:hypothetical protein
MTKRRKARIPEKQIEAHRQHSKDHHLREQTGPVGAEKDGADSNTAAAATAIASFTRDRRAGPAPPL